ncbi:MAG TPA: ATP-binding protein [Dermatophilaceae bacterium]|nr:ATP-binding protein [Dermatophilaceae bacterium]
MSRDEIDAALASPAHEVAGALLALRESQWFERKSARVAPKDLAITFIAMANAEGGRIVVGLHDGEVEDVQQNPDRLNALLQTSADFTTPPVRARSELITCVDPRGRSASLLVIDVHPGDTVHETKSGDCYLRIGDESRKLLFAQRQELTFDRGHAPYDGTPAGADLSELNESLLEDYRSTIGARGSIRSLLDARSLTRADGELTVAAYLLFAEHPGSRMPHAHVRVLRYRENERGTGARLSLDGDSDVRIEGPIPSVIEHAAAAIDSRVPARRALTASGRFELVPVIPRDAWLEGLVNAVVHRSYSMAGDHIRVEIFPNRVEIESPGRFPGIVDPTKPLDIRRYARNPRIARVCADLTIGRELGEGIHRIFDEMRIAGLNDPVYEQTAQSTRLTLLASAALPEALRRQLPRGSERILAVLRAAPTPLGTGEIMAASDLSRPTVKKALQLLRDAGYVTWTGASAKDPRATWTIT